MSRRNSDNQWVQHDGPGTQLVVGERVKEKALAQADDRTEGGPEGPHPMRYKSQVWGGSRASAR
jgi:hypothetical protein